MPPLAGGMMARQPPEPVGAQNGGGGGAVTSSDPADGGDSVQTDVLKAVSQLLEQSQQVGGLQELIPKESESACLGSVNFCYIPA